MCRRGYRVINYKGKPTVMEMNTLFYWANGFIGRRQSCTESKLDEFELATRHRLKQIYKIHQFVCGLIEQPKLHKGDIQSLGGPKFPEIFRRGLVGFKGFLVSIRRDIHIYLRQWTIAFGPSGRGVISWDHDVRGPNCCWWCGGSIFHSPPILESGFAPPWCARTSCPSMSDPRVDKYRDYVRRFNDHNVPKTTTNGQAAEPGPIAAAATHSAQEAVKTTPAVPTIVPQRSNTASQTSPPPAEAQETKELELMVCTGSNLVDNSSVIPFQPFQYFV